MAPGRPFGPATARYSLRPAAEPSSAAGQSSRSRTRPPVDLARTATVLSQARRRQARCTPGGRPVSALAGHARWRGGTTITLLGPAQRRAGTTVRGRGRRCRWIPEQPEERVVAAGSSEDTSSADGLRPNAEPLARRTVRSGGRRRCLLPRKGNGADPGCATDRASEPGPDWRRPGTRALGRRAARAGLQISLAPHPPLLAGEADE